MRPRRVGETSSREPSSRSSLQSASGGARAKGRSPTAPVDAIWAMIGAGTARFSWRAVGTRKERTRAVDYETVKKVLAALGERRVRYAIFGAVALNLHGLARFTADLDVFVAPDTENITRLKDALDSVFHDPEIGCIRADAELLRERFKLEEK
jgi:hypothetical protein